MEKVLIIDDETQLRGLLARIISLEGYDVAQAEDCAAGLKLLERYAPDVVLCDVKLPDGNGVDMAAKIKAAAPEVEVILLTAYGNIPDGVQAIKNGAFDYITKGDDNNKILPLLARAMEKVRMQRRLQRLEKQNGDAVSFDGIVGSSAPMREAVALARKVAGTDASVLLTGETGTGKDVFARAIHGGSSRSRENFVAVNCAAFTKELLESELFGHKAGAFTGAVKDKKGLLDEADGGTLFLDEIGEMAPELQAKLLRVLENGEYIRIGETRATKTDIRVIAATNRDLTREIAEGRFREDLFYRLSVFTIRLPSLADRPEDIEEYVRHFVGQFSQRMACRIVSIDPEYVRLMRRHAWRGNVRELRNVVERSMIMAEDGRLTAGDLPADFRGAEGGDADDPVSLGDMERQRQQTIAQLQQEGVWDMNREAPMPAVVQRVAIVSSANAAGYQDFCKELGKSPYRFELTLFDAFMQGEAAEESIIEALCNVAARPEKFDAVVLIRGGGSRSDLNCFNAYRLCAHVAQFPLPVVTGIGHDKDTSVADMVAHTALKTPTAVAGWLVERMAETDGWLDCAALQLNDMTKAAMHASEVRLERLSGEVRRLSGELLTRQTLRLEHFTGLLPDAARDFLARQGVRLGNAAELIAGRSPERILRLGFAVLRAGGRAVTSAGSVAEGEQVEIEVSDGKIDATVNSGKIWQKKK